MNLKEPTKTIEGNQPSQYSTWIWQKVIPFKSSIWSVSELAEQAKKGVFDHERLKSKILKEVEARMLS